MQFLSVILGVILSVFAICSTLHVLSNLRQNPDLFSQNSSRTQYFFFVVYLLVLSAFLKGGIEKFLFFIPSDWVVADELGDITSVRSTLSLFIGIIMALWIGGVTIPKLFKRNKIVLEIEEGTKTLTDLERFDKIRALGEYGESESVIRQLNKRRSEYTDFKKYLDTRKKEMEVGDDGAYQRRLKE